MSRDGVAADDGDERAADGGLSGVRHGLPRRAGYAGLLFGAPRQVRYSCRGDGHGAHFGRALHVSRRQGAHPAESGRGPHERVGGGGAPRERHGDRGHETAGDVLLQPAEGVSGVFRAARDENPVVVGLLEETAPDDGRRGGVDARQRQIQALYGVRPRTGGRRRGLLVHVRRPAGWRTGRGAHGHFLCEHGERPPEPRRRTARRNVVRRDPRGGPHAVERRPFAHPRRGRHGGAADRVLYGAVPCADPPESPERCQRGIPADGAFGRGGGYRRRTLYGLLAVGHLPQRAPAADAGLSRAAG